MIHAGTELRLQGAMFGQAATKQATRKVFHIEKGTLLPWGRWGCFEAVKMHS